MIAATTPTGRAISIEAALAILGDDADRSRAREVAQQADRLAPVLGDLVGDVAEAGVAHGELGQRAVARGLDDRPAGGGHELVDARLVAAVDRALRGARARDQRGDLAPRVARMRSACIRAHSGLIFASRITYSHFFELVPDQRRRTRPAIDGAASAPCASSFSLTSGICSTFTIAAFSFATIGAAASSPARTRRTTS